MKSEKDPLDPAPPGAMRKTDAAMAYLDQKVAEFGGIALRYGNFYGDPDYELVNAIKARRFPIVSVEGIWPRCAATLLLQVGALPLLVW